MNQIQRSAIWIRTNRALFLLIIPVTIVALVPLYGVLFPSVVDLAEHILVSKLLWEKLTGTSHLDLIISGYLGYRLFPALMLVIFSFCNLGRISFVYVPIIVTGTLISIHVIVIVSTLHFQLQNKAWKPLALRACLLLPAVVGMYSAAWFLGMVNYTLAITLLVPTIFLTERFLRSAKWTDAVLVFLALATTYIAHPFAPTFWLLWCLCRAVASIVILQFGPNWRRVALLAAIFLPILVYHLINHSLLPADNDSASSVQLVFPFLSMHEWYRDRFFALLHGYLKADDMSNSTFFGIFTLGFVVISTAFGLRARQTAQIKKLALSNFLFLFMTSWLNEKVFPVPRGTWLAYDYRYSLVVYVVCLMIAAMVFIHSFPESTDKSLHKIGFALLVGVAVLASAMHLLSVRTGFVRFDTEARKYMAKVFAHEQPVGISLPHNSWHPNGTYLKNYICLMQPDCVAEGTTFSVGYAADLFPVKLQSRSPSQQQPILGRRPR